MTDRVFLDTNTLVYFADADAGTIYIKSENNLIFTHAQNKTLSDRLPPGKKLIYSTFELPITKKSLAGYVALTSESIIEDDVYTIDNKPYGFNRSFDEKASYRTRSVMTVPLENERKDVLGVIQIINPVTQAGDGRIFNQEDMMYVNHFAGIASMIIQKAQMTRALILRMIQMAELRDPKETASHVNRVASYSVEIYERWAHHKGLPKDEVHLNKDILRMAAMLHDVGKVAISDLILKKPAKFTEEEFELMKSHACQGARIFLHAQSKVDEAARDVALTHHENWDGTGYPGHIDIETGLPLEKNSNGKALPLKGEEIPLFGRITALADVFDALSSKRVYKEAWGEDDVLKEIRELSGSKFDPDLIDVFFESLEEIRSIQKKYPDQNP